MNFSEIRRNNVDFFIKQVDNFIGILNAPPKQINFSKLDVEHPGFQDNHGKVVPYWMFSTRHHAIQAGEIG